MSSETSPGHIVILNGGSSSGKSTIGRKLQGCLEGSWLLIGIDVLIWTLPVQMTNEPDGIEVSQGTIRRGAGFLKIYEGFQHAVGALARSGIDVILDEVLIDGGVDQRGWIDVLEEFETCWIAVRCDPDIAAAREAKRGDRPAGIARSQALTVHDGVHYDHQVDTGNEGLRDATSSIADELRRRWPVGSTEPTNEPPELPPLSAWTNDGSRRLAPWEG